MQFLFVQTYFICTRKDYHIFYLVVKSAISFILCLVIMLQMYTLTTTFKSVLINSVLRWQFISHKIFWYEILIYCILSNGSNSELQLFNVKMYLYTMIYSESKTTIYDCNRFKLLYLCILLLFLWLTKDIPNNQNVDE